MCNETVLPPNPNSLRRTLSADNLDNLDHEINTNRNSNSNDEDQKKGAFDEIWSSIVSNKADSGSGFGSETPYVHPLVKRTASSLSTKSLEICTESIGSETGSDGFGSDESDTPQPELHDPISNFTVTDIIGYDYERAPPTPAITMTSSLFPPPMASLSHRMQSHRHGGRLVVDAVTVPTTTACLRSHRRDGRLLLTMDSNSNDVADYDRDDERKELTTFEFVMEEKASFRMIMSKVIGGEWRRPRNFNTTVIKDLDGDEEEKSPAMEITPVNACQYYWRRSAGDGNRDYDVPSEVVVTDEKGNNKWVLGRNGNKITAQAQNKAHDQAQVDKAVEYLVPFLKGCKVPKRPLLFWGPHCIATS